MDKAISKIALQKRKIMTYCKKQKCSYRDYIILCIKAEVTPVCKQNYIVAMKKPIN